MRQLSFKEIKEHSAENRVIYKELHDLMIDSKVSGDYKVVPFVGAGMTAFAYPMWTEALKELANELAKTLGDPPDFQNFMEQNDLEGAAEYLWKFGPEEIGGILSDIIFTPEKLDNLNIRTKPINILSGLFPSSLIITTNFDQAIEKVFSTDGKSLRTLFPGPNSNVISKLPNKNDKSFLFKVHGDVYQNKDIIVFPKSIYDKEYADGSDLVNGLGRLFEKRSMLFLGASLNEDRTLDLLEKIRKSGHSNSHYALLDFDDNKDLQLKRRKELEAYGIRPIFFPKGHYDSISVILEQLFFEVDGEKYQHFSPKLYRRFNIQNRFDWRHPLTDFLGREEEFQKLLDFIENKGSKPHITWWAVCGPGGMGKSRLVDQLSYRRPEGWDYLELSGHENISIESINKLIENRGSKIIITADYAQSSTTEIARWLRSINKPTMHRDVRLIFLQREPYQYTSYESDGERQTSQAEIKPYWLKNLEIGWNDVESLAYLKKSLDLKPLNDEAIKDIIFSYSKFLPESESESEKKRALTEKDAEALLEALKKLGDDFLRPLFAMFFADAHLSGNDPMGWDEGRILEHFSNREVMRLRDGLTTLYKNSREDISTENCEALDLIIALATIQGDLQINPKKPQIEIFGCFKNELYPPNSEFVSLYKGLTDVGLLEFDVSKKQYIFRAIRPDLLGEWTVFNYFANNKNAQSKLMNVLKQSPDEKAVEDFFMRFGGHYLSGIYVEKHDEDWIIKLKDFSPARIGLTDKPWLIELREFSPARIGLINGLATYAENNRDFSVSNIIDFLSEGFVDSDTSKSRSAFLAIKLSEQGTNSAEAEEQLLELIKSSSNNEKIETLLEADRFPESEEIALRYAHGLVNLTVIQESATEIKETVQKIEALLEERFPKSEEIALRYAHGLVNLTASQKSSEEIKETLKKIKSLLSAGRFPKSEEIALAYAKALFNLLVTQKESPKEIKGTVKKIEALLNDNHFPKSEQIAIEYAQALVNLTDRQESATEIKETVQKIEALLEERFPKSEEITLRYAHGLVNLTASQESSEEIKETLKKNKSLLAAGRFPKSEEIALAYAKALFNLLVTQKESPIEIKGTVQKIEVLLNDNRFSKSEQIAVEYSKALVSLTDRQKSAKERKETVQKIETLLEERFPKSEKIAFRYAQGLFLLAFRLESAKEREDAAQKIEALLEDDRFPNSEEIAILYAQVLGDLTVWQESVTDIKETVQKIEALLKDDRFPKSEIIAIEYAKCLVNLTARQTSAKERAKTVQKIEALLTDDRFPKSEDIAIFYAFGLVNLMVKSEDYNFMKEAYLKILTVLQNSTLTEIVAFILSNAFYHLLRVEKDLVNRRKLIDEFIELKLRFPGSKELDKLSEKFPSE